MHGHHCWAYIDPIFAHIIVISCAHAEHNLCCDAHLLGYHQADATSKWASRELGTKLVYIYIYVKSTGAYPPFLVTSHRLHVQGTFWLKDPKG